MKGCAWMLLRNTATNRWHPVLFQPDPCGGFQGAERYCSVAHHTRGFDTEEMAMSNIRSQIHDNVGWWTGVTRDWDGEKFNARTEWFKLPLNTDN